VKLVPKSDVEKSGKRHTGVLIVVAGDKVAHVEVKLEYFSGAMAQFGIEGLARRTLTSDHHLGYRPL
jgi:hypothetical protein